MGLLRLLCSSARRECRPSTPVGQSTERVHLLQQGDGHLPKPRLISAALIGQPCRVCQKPVRARDRPVVLNAAPLIRQKDLVQIAAEEQCPRLSEARLRGCYTEQPFLD